MKKAGRMCGPLGWKSPSGAEAGLNEIINRICGIIAATIYSSPCV